jgi:hypothetical protein
MEAGVAKDDFEDALSGRVALKNRLDLFPNGSKHAVI